jgi:hypothetical protein
MFWPGFALGVLLAIKGKGQFTKEPAFASNK